MLYEYTMKEQNVVQGAFRVGNHFSLRDLPTLISPFNVCEALKDSQQDGKLLVSVNSENKKVEREILKENGGIFMKFGWEAEPFDSFEHGSRRVKYVSQDKGEQINPKPFNPATIKKLEKYEYSFLAENEKSLQSFLTASDPYQAPISERLRSQWIEESKILYGEFTKAGP